MKKEDIRHSPRERAFILKNLADFQTELFRVIAGHIPGLSSFEARKRIARFVFGDARRVQDLRIRCKELALIVPEIFCSRDSAGRTVIEEIAKIPDSDEAILAAYLGVKNHLKDFLQKTLIPELAVFDSPSIEPIEQNIRSLEDQIGWVQKHFNGSPEALASSSLASALQEATSEILEKKAAGKAEMEKSRRAIGVLPLPRSRIPKGFVELSAGMTMEVEPGYPSKARSVALNFLQELQAGDSCASLLFESPDMPWEFYLDTSRHMWDEMRHCEFGEMKLRQLGVDFKTAGISNTAYTLRQTLAPLDRYAALTTQEADAFPGKHAGLKEALENDDPLAATAWSYDISDETQHVRFGQRWIPVMIAQTGELRSYEQIKADAENWRINVLAARYQPAAASFSSSAA